MFVKLFVIFAACGKQVRVGCGRNEEARTQPGTRGGGGGYFRNLLVEMCGWDPGTLNLYQS